mgnify:CR=1 FL=1
MLFRSYANDDAHRLEQTGRAWNVVRAADRSPAAIAEALRSGSFYASCGVTIDRIECDGPILSLHAPDAQRIQVIGPSGVRLRFVDAPELRLDAGELDASYIRIECLGAGGAAAWTQPFTKLWLNKNLPLRIKLQNFLSANMASLSVQLIWTILT